MKTSLIVFLILLQVCRMPVCAQEKDKEGFTLVKQEHGVSVYEKWTTWPSNPPAQSRQLKTEFFYKGSIYEGLHLVKDDKRVMEWQSHVSEHKVYLEHDTTAWLEYSYHDIPWPVSDQDHFMEYKAGLKHPGFLVITFKSKVNKTLAPIRKNVTRMELTGTWTLEQVTPDKVKATYKVLSKPLDIPKIFIDPIIRGNMVTTMSEFVQIVEANAKH